MCKLNYILLSVIFIITFVSCDDFLLKPSMTPDSTAEQQSEIEITISEPAIEAKLREILSKPEGLLTKTELEQVTEFSLMENIESIQDLQWLTNLESLHLEIYQMTDLTPLRSLKNLKTLRISDCPFV